MSIVDFPNRDSFGSMEEQLEQYWRDIEKAKEADKKVVDSLKAKEIK
jgi:hypothetical protein